MVVSFEVAYVSYMEEALYAFMLMGDYFVDCLCAFNFMYVLDDDALLPEHMHRTPLAVLVGPVLVAAIG